MQTLQELSSQQAVQSVGLTRHDLFSSWKAMSRCLVAALQRLLPRARLVTASAQVTGSLALEKKESKQVAELCQDLKGSGF